MTYTKQHHKQVMSVLLLIAGMTGGVFFIQFGSPWIGFIFAVAGGIVSLAAMYYPIDKRFGEPHQNIEQEVQEWVC